MTENKITSEKQICPFLLKNYNLLLYAELINDNGILFILLKLIMFLCICYPYP